MKLEKNEVDILHELGSIYMEYASLPLQKEKMGLWKKLNRSQMQRPMVVIDQIPWNELEQDDFLVCKIKDRYWRQVEQQLRRTIYQWRSFPADMVLRPYITVPALMYTKEYGLSREVTTIQINENETASAQHYKNQIKTPEDISKIKDMEIVYKEEETKTLFQQAQRIFEGIAPVKSQRGLRFHLGVWDHLTTYMGISDIYMDFMERPEFIHQAMRRITDATVAGIKEANRLMIHDDDADTCHCSYIYTDELLPDFEGGKGSVSKNCWAFGLAQLFTSVSPAMMAEFEIPYISEMAEYFGMIYYGCCDRLDDRLDIVKKIPNLKKVSCSPWSNRENFAEQIGKKLIMSNKPTPALLAGAAFDREEVKKDLERTLKCARSNSVNLEIILKDISTVKFDAERLREWERMAMELVCGY